MPPGNASSSNRQDGNGGRVIAEDQGRSDAGRKLLQSHLGLSDDFRDRAIDIGRRLQNGVCYAYFNRTEAAAEIVARTPNAIMEFTPEAQKSKLTLWPSPGPDFE